MPSGWRKHLLLVFAALFLPVILFCAAALYSSPAAESDPLVGKLLIASPRMVERLFYRTVILVVEHNEVGALGIVINQPFEERSIASLLEGIGKKHPGVEGSVLIFAGGPMEPDIGFIVHSTDYRRPETRNIDGRIAMTSSPEVLRDIGHNMGPRKSLVAFGYTGWGPGQLEVELARHDWLTISKDPKLIFDEDRKRVWDEAMARLGQPL